MIEVYYDIILGRTHWVFRKPVEELDQKKKEVKCSTKKKQV